MRARHIRCRPFVAKTAAVGAIISLIGGFSFLGNADFAASVERLVRSIGAVEYTFQAFDNEAGARALAQCFNASTTGDSLFNNFSSGGTLAAVVPLSGLLDLSSSEYDGNVSQAVTASLHALIRGGVQHIILVPGNAPSWSVDLLSECHAAVQHGAVDGRGFPTSVAFSALSPATVSCIGTPPAGLAAGVAWAVSAGASAVLALEHVTALSRRALFFDAALPRLLPQVAGLHEPTGRPEDISEVAGAALPVFSPLPQEWLSVPKQIQQHFTACGGLTPVCSPITSRSLRLCSRWLRPAVQYGLCHNRSLYSRGRHTTVAANSPFDDVLFSGPRLLEEVTTLTLTQGATVALRSDSRFIFNRLAHRDAAWVLVDTEVLGGAAAQLAVESALSLVLGGNLTVLPPGRLCNVTVTQKPSRGAEEVGSPGSEFLSEADAQDWDTTSRAAVAAAFQAVGSNCADRQLNRTDTVSGEGLVAAVHALALALVQRSALRTEGADGLLRWMRIFVAALRLDEQRRQYARDAAVRSRAPSPSSSPSVLPRISLSSKRVVPSVLPNVTRPTPSHPASAFEQVAHAKLCVSIPSLPSLQPTARAVYKHCFAGHHNGRRR